MSEGFLRQNSSPFTKMCSSARCRPNFSWHIIHSTIQILQNPHVNMWTMIRWPQSLVGNSYGAQARLEHTQSLHHVTWCYCTCSSCYIMLKHYTNTYKIVHEFWLSASLSLRHSRLKSANWAEKNWYVNPGPKSKSCDFQAAIFMSRRLILNWSN